MTKTNDTTAIDTMMAGKPPYILDNYSIDPIIKTISVYRMVGGTKVSPDGQVMHWDGFTYEPDTTIKYDETALVILGNQVFFKEHFETKCDYNTLKVLYSNYIYYNTVLFKDKNTAYYCSSPNQTQKIDLSAYKALNDYVYENTKGKRYFLNVTNSPSMLEEIVGLPDLDIPSLKHIVENYYTDKNGLYIFGNHSKYIRISATEDEDKWIEKSEQLESSGGKAVEPIVYRNYFTYNQSVYALAQRNAVALLDLNVKTLKEFELNSYNEVFFITDGNKLYDMRRSGYSPSDFNAQSFNYRYKNTFFKKNVDKWQIITQGDISFIEKKNGAELYFPSANQLFSGLLKSEILVHTPEGFFTFTEGGGESLKKIDKVFIRNYDTKKYEPLEPDKYRYVADNLYVYKNRVYAFDSRPIKEEIDGSKLEFISHHGVKTDYLTDGKSLIYVGNMTGYSTDDSSGDEQIIYSGDVGRIKHGVDFSTLKVVRQDILIDKNYIYSGNYNGITIIPMHKLGFEVKVFTEE